MSEIAVVSARKARLQIRAAKGDKGAKAAIKLAEQLNKEGIKAVPIFWIASEDHDFDEISKTILKNKSDELKVIENQPEDLTPGQPVRRAYPGEDTVNQANAGFPGGYKRAHLSHKGYQADLAEVG